ncbi:MAG: PD-(D/E)XK nuclease family protein [Gammaproteobacteria bacterium]
MYEALTALQDGVTVITSTRRLARTLGRQHDRWQAQRGRRAWPSARAWQWSDWLEQLWLSMHLCEAGASPMLLNRLQEHTLWEQVIRDTPEARELLQPSDIARAAHTAWQVLHAFEISLESPHWRLSPDSRAFAVWSKRYASALADGRFLDHARLPTVIAELIPQVRFPVPPAVLFVGFDEWDKQQQHLVESLRASGCVLRQSVPREQGKHAVRAAFADPYEEVTAAAIWIGNRLQRHSEQVVGVAVAGLDSYRPVIGSSFADILEPGAVLPEAFGEGSCFDISLGRVLVDYPLVRTALQVLALVHEPQALGEMGSLLRSPHIGGAEREMTQRALLDGQLLKRGQARVALDSVRHLAGGQQTQAYHCPILGQALERLQQQVSRVPLRQSAAAWAMAFSQLLHSLGWPGERALSSDEYQTAQAWDKLLQELASLSCVLPQLTYGDALQQLRRAARERAYQAEAPEVPIQIMDIGEVHGMRFDALWVLGLHDERWPPAAEPVPFIPMPLQHQAGIPGASAGPVLARAVATTEQLIGCAPEVVLSYPQREGDRRLAASPLINPIPATNVNELLHPWPEAYARQIWRQARLDHLNDTSAPPLALHTRARGGAGVIREQARCPFRAFAIYRLGARPLGEGVPGLDRAQRGALVHRVLQDLWSALGSQAALRRLSEPALTKLTREAVKHALEDAGLDERFRKLEGERLIALIQEWLEVERARAPFEVLATEARREFTIGGLTLEVHIDRIDRLSDGHLAVIDYKTGDAAIEAWFEERPEEPQLPIYALVLGEDCAMLAFAKLKRGQCSYRGLCAAQEAGPGLAALQGSKWANRHPSWEALLAIWRAQIESLAAEFRLGNARVAPKNAAETCRTCALPGLCRIAEINATGPQSSNA